MLVFWLYLQYGWDFLEKFGKTPEKLSVFPGISLKSTAGTPPSPINFKNSLPGTPLFSEDFGDFDPCTGSGSSQSECLI